MQGLKNKQTEKKKKVMSMKFKYLNKLFEMFLNFHRFVINFPYY